MPERACRTAREFGNIFRAAVARCGAGWDWRKDMRPWLAGVFEGAKFGGPAFDWSPDAARDLAGEFITEASTW